MEAEEIHIFIRTQVDLDVLK